jgi:co-chaperonin GroES (HSP10)
MLENTSGLTPKEFKVIVQLKPVEAKTAGGIIIPDQTQEKEKFATTEGRIVATSPGAFLFMSREEWDGQQPKVGDVVVFAKYAGLHKVGKDGKDYVILNDKDICATIEE